MVNEGINATLDLNRSRLKLRDDLVFVPQRSRGQTYYHIESTALSKFYRIGYAEYLFISLLDGETTFTEALALSAQKLGPSSLTTQQALRTYMWLLENDLGRLLEQQEDAEARNQSGQKKQNPLQLFNLFWIKIPLCRPDRVIEALLPFVAWIFSPLVTVCGILLVIMAPIALTLQWDRFLTASQIVFSPSNWLWMAVAWVGLKIVHELAHAIACRRYGSDVREIGIVFVLLAPMAYVDVTSSWRLPSKWKRIHIAAAGMYVELVVAAIATFIWLRTDSELVSHLLYNLMFVASVSTIAFNANPLMRFDGYYILSDLLEIPNLYEEGKKSVRRQVSRIFWGEPSGDPHQLGAPGWLIGLYGWFAAAWRVLVCASLALMASVLFHGAGVIIAVFGVLCWLGTPLLSMGRELIRRFHENRRTFWRATALSVVVVGSVAFLLCWMPNPITVSAPGVVEYKDVIHVRTLTSGFIHEILVKDGERVEAGDVLMVLDNPDVSNQYFDLLISIEQARLRYRIALDEHQVSAAQVERRNRLALEEKLTEARRRFEALQVRAPESGTVVRRLLVQLKGTYVNEGTVLLSIGDDNSKEMIVSITQEDFDSVVPSLGEYVHIRVASGPRIQGTMFRLEPRASTELPHPALAATEGGPLTVVESENPTDSVDSNMILTEPRFRGIVSIPVSSINSLFSGQRGYAMIGWRRESIGVYVYQSINNWVNKKIEQAKS